MKMRKLLVALLAAVVVAVGCVALVSCKDKDTDIGDYKVAMITDYGDITDQSFNQTTYEACKEFCGDKISFKYYKPTANNTEARVASVNTAIAAGYNVIVMPGYAFAGTIVEVAEANPKVTFIALDVSLGDLLEAKYGKDYDFNPDNPKWTWRLPNNVCTFTYQEELAGYMAGYAAVKEGYEKLGFLGGMAVPAVIRFGHGYVQGIDAAAKEMGKADKVTIEYIYGGQFFGDDAITGVMDTWYKKEKGVEIVFACGGGIYTSACEAATKKGINGKVIGVDTDQSYVINKNYGNICVTSAMKGLAPTVKTVLADFFAEKWNNYAGKINNMGLVSGTDASLNYVQLPTDTWSMTKFTKDNYAALVKDMYDGKIIVSNDTNKMPITTVKVNTHENIH